jgi:hypothetical protein
MRASEALSRQLVIPPAASPEAMRRKLKSWGITVPALAASLGVSGEYVRGVLENGATAVPETACAFEQAIARLVDERRRNSSFGTQMRAARIGAGYTLKEIAGLIGYTWVAVQRWEKDVCLPKPGVLLHLRSLYGADEQWEVRGASPLPRRIPLHLHSRTSIQKPRRV